MVEVCETLGQNGGGLEKGRRPPDLLHHAGKPTFPQFRQETQDFPVGKSVEKRRGLAKAGHKTRNYSLVEPLKVSLKRKNGVDPRRFLPLLDCEFCTQNTKELF